MKLNIPKKPLECHQYINGKWQPGEGEAFEVFSPVNGAVIGKCTSASNADVTKSVNSAKEVQKAWALTPVKERSQVMFNFRNILHEMIDEISHINSAECGKTFAEARAGMMKGIEVLEYAISLQNLDLGGRMEVSRGVSCEYRREPLGVIANITPFNFPAMVPMWTIPIALTLGNAYIWKPSEKTPLTGLKLVEALEKAGLPKGLFQVLQGGAQTVNAIIDNEDVKAVGFVGSSKIAKMVYQRASNLGKRALCLGGAKNHIVLLPDAQAELAGRGISDSFTGCAGQRCMAASVLLAVGDVDSHIEAIKNRASSLKLGEEMGAIITREQVDFLNQAIDDAIKDGATVVLDGRGVKAPVGYEEGYWLGPTILDNVKPGSFAHKTELFGPVMSIIRCENIAQAMEIENSIPYGNACSVFTGNGALAEKVIAQAKAGMVGVNVGVPVPREPFSFGGVNESKFGYGDITGVHSLNFWTDIKKVTTKWEKQTDSNWMS
jgi:malonate-semialdehyde dehydrogenase (acetylating)/methylmalonate-semialdehyde dehydrogenase